MASLRLIASSRLLLNTGSRNSTILDHKCATKFSTHMTVASVGLQSVSCFSISTPILPPGRKSLLMNDAYNPERCWSYTSVRYKREKIRLPYKKEIVFDGVDIETALPSLDESELRPGYEDVTELESATEELRRMFTLEFGDGRDKLKKRVDFLLAKIQEHPAEVQTLEVQIAVETLKIRNLMVHVLEYRRDKKNRNRMYNSMNSRKAKLLRLREMDYERYQWLCNELGLTYTPISSEWENFKYSKRAARKQAARKAFFSERNEKLLQLQKRLEEERVKFEIFKQKELDDLEAEMKSLGVQDMSSMETAYAELGLSDMLYRPPEKQNRRRLLLQRKFELYKDRAKQEIPT